MKIDSAKLAINFIRKRQEYSDLRYWLALVAYDPEERTVSNKFYLVYLVIFFAIWIFMVLIFAAKGLLNFFELAAPMPPALVVSFLLLLTFSIFALVMLIGSSVRSALVFSEEDRFLLCQQPIPTRHLVMRWLPLPWIQSLTLLILISLMLGFSLGEITFPADDIASYFLVYVWFGLRAALLAIPFHFALFSSSWAVGLFALRHRGQVKSYLPVVGLGLLVLILLASVVSSALFGLGLPFSEPLNNFLYNLLLAFFGQGEFGFGLTLLYGLILSAGSLIWLWLAAKDFNPAKAAHETQTSALLSSFLKYGQMDAIDEIRKKRRLGLIGHNQFLPDWQNNKSFAWKTIIQARRTLRFSDFYLLFVSLLLTIGFQFTGNTPAGWLGLASWIWMLSRRLLEFFKQDLSLWTLTRQVPFPMRSWAFFDLILPTIPHLIVVTIGLLISLLVFPVKQWVFIFLLPLSLLSAMLQLGQDILRKNKVELLNLGTVQSYGLRGLLMALLCLLLPLFILWLSSSFLSLAGSLISSGLLFWFSYSGLESQLKRLQFEKESILL